MYIQFQAKRQQRKLNFLITQTELYAHFMSRKINGLQDIQEEQILRQLDEPKRDSDAPTVPKDDDNYGKYVLISQKVIRDVPGRISCYLVINLKGLFKSNFKSKTNIVVII